MKHPVRTVLFDFDMTLADSSVPIVSCVRHALDTMRADQPPESEIRRAIGLPLPETYTFLTGRDDGGERHEFSRLFVEHADLVMVEQTAIFGGVPELLAKLHATGMHVGIVSTKFRSRIESILHRNGLFGYVDLVIGSEDVARHKPDPECLLMALNRFQTPPDRATYIGDHPMDAEAARRASIPFIAVTSGVTDADGWDARGQAVVAQTVDDLGALLAGRAGSDLLGGS